ncbi:MAG: site-specific DNA-methyltransferase [Candidatus Bathyarchaeota archaeon]|nr:site-specific DNA-methyltransferase [Candidatus Bathyarchaeota archaeon]
MNKQSESFHSLFKPEPDLVYINSHGTLFNSDCFDLLHSLKENSIDLVFTDPPFNLGKDYATPRFNDRKKPEEYEAWCHLWLTELIRVLRLGGTLTIYQWPKWFIDLGAWLSKIPDIQYRSLISLKMKSGFPIKGRLHPANYGILYYVKRGRKPTFNVVRHRAPVCRHCGKEIRDYGGYRKKFEKFEDEDGIPWIQISDFWEDTRPARQDKSRKIQINELPLHIPERVILMASNPGDVVLDIFGGGGSTYHAAQIHDRFWIGCDIAETSTRATLNRFAAIFGRKEQSEPPEKIAKCFRSEYIQYFLEKKKDRGVSLIRAVPTIKNSKCLLNGSKSKTLGF